MMRGCYLSSFLGIVGVSLSLAGCRNCCAPAPVVAERFAFAQPPAFGYLPPHRLTPLDSAPIGQAPAQTYLQNPLPASPQSYGQGPVPAATWQGTAADQPARTLPPYDSPRPDARLLPPTIAPETRPSEPKPAISEERRPMPSREEPSKASPLPVGIPRFASVQSGVATGLRPMLDGLDWLQANGYRTVLQIRTPDTDDSADRGEIEKRGIKYISLAVSPQTLYQGTVDDFSRIVAANDSLPVFVYDKDGALAGALWYLHFRLAERLSEEEARQRATQLGLKEAGTDDERPLWLAIQKLLSTP